jgi:capsular polysaccharide biosynthesis protein
VALCAAGSAYLYSRLQQPLYRSTIRLEVSARFDNGQQLALERLIPQLSQRIRTTDLAREVDTRLRLDLGPDAILGKLRTEPSVQSAQILIEGDDVDGARAEKIVLESARVFEEQQAARNQGIPTQDRAIVSILDRPSPARLVWPQTRAIVLAAALLGLVAGGLLALGVHYLDDTLKSADDVAQTLDLVTLASIPRGDELLVGEPPGHQPLVRAGGRALVQ